MSESVVYIGNPNTKRVIYAWPGYPWWAELAFKMGNGVLNIHLQAVLCCLGVNWRVRWKWFEECWEILLYRGWRRLLVAQRG